MRQTHIVLWKWKGAKEVARSYSADHVNGIVENIKRFTTDLPVRVICVTDDAGGISECETHPLWSDCADLVNAAGARLPSCYRRLKLYDPETQRDMGIENGDRILGLDLDVLVTNHLRDVLNKEGLFVGWKLAGTEHDEVYNGSFQMFTAGTLEDVWYDFDPDSSPQAARRAGFYGSDQSWLSWKLIKREGCTNIDYPFLASYPLHILRLSNFSVKHRIVFFHGSRKPWDPASINESPWIRRYWRPEHALSQ